MWEWQSLLQITPKICVVLGRMELRPSFLRARLSAAAVINLSLPVLRNNSPLCAISCNALPGRSDDVNNLNISYADISISQVRAAGGSSPLSQLTIEDGFWNAAILHSADMTQLQGLRCLSIVYTLGRPTRDRTSALVTLYCQDMPSIIRGMILNNIVTC